MANTRIALSPYQGYFIVKVNGCKYYVNRIINPAKVNLRGRQAVHELNREDIVYVGIRYGLQDAYALARHNKKATGITNETMWELRNELKDTPKENIGQFWAKAKKMGIEQELRLYLEYPAAEGPVCL